MDNQIMDTENYKPYSAMTDWERESAIHSARYILEDMSMEDVEKATGIPMGVIVAAYKNIFVKNDSHMVFTIYNGYVEFRSEHVRGSEPFIDNSLTKTVDKIKDRYKPATIEIIKN
jgi:hypothetical protein